MATQPPSLTWKELLNMPPEQGVEVLLAQPQSIQALLSDAEDIGGEDAIAALALLDLFQQTSGNSSPDLDALITKVRGRAPVRLEPAPEGVTKKSSNIGGSGSINIDPVEFASIVDAPPEATKAAPIEVPPVDIGPLANAVGKAVYLDDLTGLTLKSGGDYFSETVKQTLENAAHAPEFVSSDGTPVISPYSYLRAAYLDSGAVADGSIKTAHNFLTDWLGVGPDGPRPLNLGRIEGSAVPLGDRKPAVSADLVAIFALAAAIVQDTHLRQKRVDARHVLAAFFLSAPGLQAFIDMDALDGGPGMFFRALRDAFLEHVLEQATKGENKQAWTDVFTPLDDDGHFTGLRLNRRVTVHYPDYASDTPGTLEGDQLGVADDARALADLICLNDADPPLAIGLFGNWGAGKSTFMQMIEEAVGENTQKVRDAREGRNFGGFPFVERVVHIRFNAWHYLDANLWASLVTHIFRELHRQSSEPTGNQGWLSETKVDALIDRLEVVRQVEKDARAELDKIGKSIDEARARLEELEKEKVKKRKSLVSDQIMALADALPEAETRAEIDKAVKALGLNETVSTVSQLKALAAETRTIGGRVKLLMTTAAEGDEGARRSMFLGLFAFVLLGGLSVLAAILIRSEAVSALIGQLGLFASVAGGAVAWMLPHLKHINKTLKPLFDGHARVLKEQEDRARQLATDRAKAQQELDKLNAEQSNKERELETNLLERERLEEIARGDRPTELLTRFIEDRASAEGYRKHLGLLSHIRRDFETMSTLMREQRQHPEPIPPTEELPRIDRIVLYIDDLDRCRDGQVVEVLEAIHLLLAFDLFVVVVGVDARWLQHSLKEFYDQQLSTAEKPELGKPTVADYLEKIFQVPFHLRPLEFNEGGSYGRLMDKLVGEVTTTPGRGDGGKPDQDAIEPDGNAGKPGDTKDGKALRTLDLVLPAIEETPEETMQRVMLSDRELATMRRLGPLVGRSPRAVKRFVNLYRLMRTRRRGAELETFLNKPKDGVAPFRVYLLWLGLETKLTPVQLASLKELLFYAYNGRENADGTVGSRLSGQPNEQYSAEEEGKAVERLRKAFWASIPDVESRRPVLTEIEAAYSVPLTTLRNVVAEVSRYSFRLHGN